MRSWDRTFRDAENGQQSSGDWHLHCIWNCVFCEADAIWPGRKHLMLYHCEIAECFLEGCRSDLAKFEPSDSLPGCLLTSIRRSELQKKGAALPHPYASIVNLKRNVMKGRGHSWHIIGGNLDPFCHFPQLFLFHSDLDSGRCCVAVIAVGRNRGSRTKLGSGVSNPAMEPESNPPNFTKELI